MNQIAIDEKPEAPYPGAPILLMRFRRGEEAGDVRVQDYGAANKVGSRFKVGQFVPGIVECSPGDTPKIWPEVHQYVATFEESVAVFNRYTAAVLAAGWEVDDG